MQVDLYNGRKTVVVVAVLYEWSGRDTTVFTDAHSHTHTHTRLTALFPRLPG